MSYSNAHVSGSKRSKVGLLLVILVFVTSTAGTYGAVPTKPVFIADAYLASGEFFVGAGLGLFNARRDREWGGAYSGWGTLAAAFELRTSDKLMLASKLSWFNTRWMFLWGASMLYYSDFDDGSLVFRPQLGLSLGYPGKIRLTVGYNAPLINTSFGDLAGFVLSLGTSVEM